MFASRRGVAAATRHLALCRNSAAPWARCSSTEAAASSPSPAAADAPPSAAPNATAVAMSRPPDRQVKSTVPARTPPPRTAPPRTPPPRTAPSIPYAKFTSAATNINSTNGKSASASVSEPPRYELSKVVHRVKLPAAAESREATPPDVDWVESFHGISTKPVTEEQFQVLMQPLSEHDIEVKPDGIIYLPEIKYRRRLNEAFGPMGWGLIPKSEPVVGENIVTREYALIVDGRFVSQAQGENGFFGRDQLPSAIEGCKSNALMRCCKDLGIGSELWDPHFIRWFKKTRMEEAWVEHATTKKRRTLWFRKGAVEVTYPYKLTK